MLLEDALAHVSPVCDPVPMDSEATIGSRALSTKKAPVFKIFFYYVVANFFLSFFTLILRSIFHYSL